MSKIKKIRKKLSSILGRPPTIHEEIDYILWDQCREHVLEMRFAYQMNPDENYRDAYESALKSLNEIQDRNPEIFIYNDSDGGRDDGDF